VLELFEPSKDIGLVALKDRPDIDWGRRTLEHQLGAFEK
jgi:hypothetical protein